ncbi:MAG: hypothetical protein JXC32_21285 [Anaerolineae bacterium]|nr:hypothetical protein [Anaerolineae bacterium]
MRSVERMAWGAILTLALIAGSLWVTVIRPGARQDCTIFTAAQGDTVLFGNSEDTHFRELLIGFYPASGDGYGSVHFGFRMRNGSIQFGGAVNDQGLAWDLNSTPRFRLNPHPELPYSHAQDNYLSTITEQAATVEEAIRIAKNFDFGDELEGQFHIADATGDAVVISAGPDGEIAFTHKAPGEGHLVSTNFALGAPERGPVDWRYATARLMLDAGRVEQALTPSYAMSVLDAVHLRTLTSFTLYANVIDLKNQVIYLTYMSQFGEVVEIDIGEELSKGQRISQMAHLFRTATVEAGDADYGRFAARFHAAIAAVLALGVASLVGTTVMIVKRVSRRRRTRQRKGE